jgi:hypothetical protein
MSEGWLQQNQKLIIGFFYNENGSKKKKAILPKTKKIDCGCSTAVKVK